MIRFLFQVQVINLGSPRGFESKQLFNDLLAIRRRHDHRLSGNAEGFPFTFDSSNSAALLRMGLTLEGDLLVGGASCMPVPLAVTALEDVENTLGLGWLLRDQIVVHIRSLSGYRLQLKTRLRCVLQITSNDSLLGTGVGSFYLVLLLTE